MIQKIYNGKDEVLPYIALEPKCLKPDLPIIVHLHGAGRRGDGADEIHLLEGDDFFKLVAEKDVFAALVLVCGGGIPWFSDVLRMPIRAFHETEDSSVLPHDSIDMVNAIRGYGKNKNVELIMLDGVGHNAWEYAYSDELIGWLLSCRSK